MSFELRRDESVEDGLRRLAKKSLQSAREGLNGSVSPSDDAIHEARTRIKKVRAIVELLDADDASGLRGCRRRLRRVSRTLSGLRDADAMLETLEALRKRHQNIFREHAIARFRKQLASNKHAARMAARSDGAWTDIDRDLRQLRRRGKRWSATHANFGALAPGLERTHRRGREAIERARTHRGASDFHEWRKAAKALWYDLRLLSPCGAGIRADIRALHQAQSLLGDDHNLVLLCAELSKDPSLCDLERLRRAVESDQRELRRRALASAGRIYARKSRAYVRRVQRAWTEWRDAGARRKRAAA